jgi:hypothetical protein
MPASVGTAQNNKRSSRTGLSITIAGESASERNLDGKRSWLSDDLEMLVLAGAGAVSVALAATYSR